MKAFVLSLFVALECVGFSWQAEASIVDVTLTGQVYDGGDNSGTYAPYTSGNHYGVPSFSGQSFTLTYSFDTADASASSNWFSGSIVGTESMTINGISAPISLTSCYGSPGCSTSETMSTTGATFQESYGGYGGSFVTAMMTGTNTGSGSFQFGNMFGGTSGKLVIESESLTTTPLPASLPFFAVGFLGLALMVRRKNMLSRLSR